MVIRDRWKKTWPKTMLLKQRFKLPSQTPTTDMIERRSKTIENILLNQCNEDPSKTSYVYSLLGIVLGIVFTLMLTSYPQHYPIGNSKYWYEFELVPRSMEVYGIRSDMMNLYGIPL